MTDLLTLFQSAQCLFRGHDWETIEIHGPGYAQPSFFKQCTRCTETTDITLHVLSMSSGTERVIEPDRTIELTYE